MKLYGKIKSERAESGQGGNDFLKVEILNANQDVVATIKATLYDSGIIKLIVNNDSRLSVLEKGVEDKCECTDALCAKCLLVNCQDDNCLAHPLSKKIEFRELYKNRK